MRGYPIVSTREISAIDVPELIHKIVTGGVSLKGGEGLIIGAELHQ